jgi:hypothetical protein
MVRRLLAIGLLLVLGARAAGAQPARAASRVDRVEQWLRALAGHAPGEVDEPLRSFAVWSPDDWQKLVQDAQLVALLLEDPDRANLGLQTLGSRRRTQPDLLPLEVQDLRRIACALRGGAATGCASGSARLDPELDALATRAARARQRGDERYVVRLAILLHTDLIAWGGTQDAAPARLAVDVTDGQGGGSADDTVHWAIAYGVLDALSAGQNRAAPDAWIRDWYVATAMLMQQNGRSDQLHVDRALKAFPDDPDVRFISACQHEIDASPVIQQALQAVAASLPRGASTSIANTRGELRAAESDLRAVVARRGNWGEAHLRLGRVLAQLGNRQQSEVHLQRALDATADDAPLNYLAALFLGATHEQAGRFDRARDLYARAAGHFPTAPSAQLALSQLARRQGDGAGAEQALQNLLTGSDAQTVSDPWWHYLTLQARDSGTRLDRLRATVVAVSAP